MKKFVLAKISANQVIDHKHGFLILYCPELLDDFHPGQFVAIRCSNSSFDPLLRRPFSIAYVDYNDKVIGILYRVIGSGTLWLSKRHPGEAVDVLGPLGKGFRLPSTEIRNIAVVGRGTGVASLLALSESAVIEGYKCYAYFSFSSKVLGEWIMNNFKKFFEKMIISTDDRIIVSNNLIDDLRQQNLRISKIYVCGSKRLLLSVRNICREYHLPAEVSIETMMGCGVGLCKGCAVKLRSGVYAYACIDGPVFDVEELEI
jgi:dihydroorotate dehydrogenase electron transfer subunit